MLAQIAITGVVFWIFNRILALADSLLYYVHLHEAEIH